MRKSLKGVLLISSLLLVSGVAVASTSASSEITDQTEWYGLLTVDKFPLDNCYITSFAGKTFASWVSGGTALDTQAFLEQMEKDYADYAKSKGFNAVLGFRVASIRSGVGVAGSPFGTVIQLNGVAVKVRCESTPTANRAKGAK